MVENKPTRPLKTVETALDIVDFVKEQEGANLQTIADCFEMAKSTAHGYTKTLEQRGYLVKDGDSYYVGLEYLDKGGHARRRKPEYDFIIDKVDDLAERTGERAQFIVEENGYGYYIHRSVGEDAVHVDARMGKKIPLHASSAGKAILAELSEETVDRIVDRWGLEPITEHTITDRDELKGELNQIQQDGYAISDQESINRLRAVGVPIVDEGHPLGAISLSGPAHRMRDTRIDDEIIELLLGAVNEIELDLKYQ